MQVSRSFEVASSRDQAVEVLDQDETLTALFPDMKSEIVARDDTRKTVVSHYRALGREGDATFHFDFLMDGSIRFEKVCDGNVWRDLHGEVTVDELAADRARISIEMQGRTKGLVPEFTIKGPMQEQVAQMAQALRERIEAAGSV